LINPARKTYVFKLPLNSKIDYSGYLTDVVVGRTSFLSSAIIKSDTLAPVVLDTVPVEKSLIHYVVKINEPLKNLAKFFQVTEEDLRQWNNLKLGDMAVKGQTLVIYQ
jgi:LysM repeat protein